MSRLYTPEQEAELLANGELSESGNDIDPHPVVKLYALNSRAIWLLTELSTSLDGLAFGLCDLGMGEPELGNVYIPDLEAFKHATRDAFLIERDLEFEATHPLSVYTLAADYAGEIVEDTVLLDIAKRIVDQRRPE